MALQQGGAVVIASLLVEMQLQKEESFKKINDTYGHTVGDDAIRTVSRLLSHWVGTPDTVIRFAGDEFTIICVNKSQNEVTAL